MRIAEPQGITNGTEIGRERSPVHDCRQIELFVTSPSVGKYGPANLRRHTAGIIHTWSFVVIVEKRSWQRAVKLHRWTELMAKFGSFNTLIRRGHAIILFGV